MEKYKPLYIAISALLFATCASTIPAPKYMPSESDNVFPFFSAGQPIAGVNSSNAFMLLSLDRTSIANIPFVRLWFLYRNNSDEPYLLEPQRFISMRVTSIKRKIEGTTRPTTPTKILASISNEKAVSMIVQAIGGTLQSMAAKPSTTETKFSDGTKATTTFNDLQGKKDSIQNRTRTGMANTAMWYEIYQNSISDGILRKNTVFPGQSVNGYIYFPIPRPVSAIDPYTYSYPSVISPAKEKEFITINMDFLGEVVNVYFTQIEGE